MNNSRPGLYILVLFAVFLLFLIGDMCNRIEKKIDTDLRPCAQTVKP